MARKPKDYLNGKVYVIRNTDNDKVYVGSTTQPLCKRMARHRQVAKTYTFKIYQNMRDIGIDKFYIELLELYPCQTQEQLNKREGELIREHNSVVDGYNSVIAGRTKTEWNAENADKNRKQKAKWNAENADKIRDNSVKYRAENADTERERKAKWNAENADTERERKAKWNAENADKVREQKAKYYAENRDTINARARERYALKKQQST